MTAKKCDIGREKSLWQQSPGCLLRRRGVRNGSIEKATSKEVARGAGGYSVYNELAVRRSAVAPALAVAA